MALSRPRGRPRVYSEKLERVRLPASMLPLVYQLKAAKAAAKVTVEAKAAWTAGQLADWLGAYNAWRRGEDIPMPCPKVVGEVIDLTIAELNKSAARLLVAQLETNEKKK